MDLLLPGDVTVTVIVIAIVPVILIHPQLIETPKNTLV